MSTILADGRSRPERSGGLLDRHDLQRLRATELRSQAHVRLRGFDPEAHAAEPRHVDRELEGAKAFCGTSSLISKSSDDCFLVSIRDQGRRRWCSRTWPRRRPGGPDFALYDSSRQYELQFEQDFEQIVLKLSGDSLRNAVRDTGALTASKVSGESGAGHLLINMLKTLRDNISSLEPASALAVAEGVKSITGRRPADLAQRSSDLPSPNLAAFHMPGRIKSMVEEHLNDADLSVASIAEHLGLSSGHVHRLFKDEASSLSHYIWNKRLEACSRDLIDPRQGASSVGEIAYRRGFNDAAHFSRAFFISDSGCSPGDWRCINKPDALSRPCVDGREPARRAASGRARDAWRMSRPVKSHAPFQHGRAPGQRLGAASALPRDELAQHRRDRPCGPSCCRARRPRTRSSLR